MDLSELATLLEASGARWTAGETALSNYDVPPESMDLLGYVPGPNEPTLAEQEAIARSGLLSYMAIEDRSYPDSYDWRSVGGDNYISQIRDQSRCGSCVAFASCATVEGTLRVQEQQPDLDIDLSEAHLFYCIARSQGRRCGGRQAGGWFPNAALDAFRDEGVSDEPCYPYIAGDQECTHLCDDWGSRLTTINGWHEIHEPDGMREWLATRGPLVATMSVYEDFRRYYRGGIYRYVTGKFEGGHCISIIGYDDPAECWIGKNSWGTNWGENGFFRIAYADSAIDSTMWAVDGVIQPAPPNA